MMDFPASPTVGQIANGYVWNGVLWAGSAPSAGGAIVSISDTAPSAPADNSLFWQSSTGAFYVRYNDGSSTQYVQLNSWPTSLNFVPTTGGTMSGDLTISKSGPVIAINDSAPGGGYFVKKSSLNRWALGTEDAESSGNAGSNLKIFQFNDAGSYLGTPFIINRATGNVTAQGLPARPTMTAGVVGDWRAITGAVNTAIPAPAGGTWAWFGFLVVNTQLINIGIYGGVVAGGATMMSAQPNMYGLCVCWRIA